MRTLHEQFKELMREKNISPIIELSEEFDYEYFYINSTEKGLEAGGCSNCGFFSVNREALTVEWDECFSLDEHLEFLLELCQNYMLIQKMG